MSYGFFEVHPTGGKARVLRDLAFASVADAIAHFGDKVVCAEIEDDGSAGDVFVSTGALYAVEAI